MRVARIAVGDQTFWGVIEKRSDRDEVESLSAAPWDRQARLSGERYILDHVRLLPPTMPSKIAAVGRNYADHARERELDVSPQPRIFFKPPSSIIGPGEAIRYPSISHEVHHEAELAVVIGRRCRDLAPEDAYDVIFGYTCANDVTDRDIQRVDGQPSFAKAFDTFCPLGPWIETALDPSDVTVSCIVNGEPRQRGQTKDMLWPVPDLLAYITGAMTLLPGDVILTGTPAGVGPIRPGDDIAVTIGGIGTLTNHVLSA